MNFINMRTFPDARKRKLYISPKVKYISLEGEHLLAGSDPITGGNGGTGSLFESGSDDDFSNPRIGGRANLGIFSDDYYDDEFGEY